MIGRLAGKLISKQPPRLLLDVNGVGYEIEAPLSTFYNLPDDRQLTLLIHTLVREDALQLYGFTTEAERQLFRTLIKISGIGAKLALTILSGIETGQFMQCIQNEDSATLTRLPGVGKKTAQRLVVELKDKLAPLTEFALSGNFVVTAAASPQQDAINALLALGYKPAEATRMVKAVAVEDMSTETIIRLALQTATR